VPLDGAVTGDAARRPRLAELLAGTNFEGVTVISTRPDGDPVYNERNPILVSQLLVMSHEQPVDHGQAAVSSS
jgi:hypothetical protein